MIHHIVQFALRQRFLMLMLIVLMIVARHFSFHTHAGRRLPRPFAPHGRTHYAVARPRRRGSRAPDNASRSKLSHERHAEPAT